MTFLKILPTSFDSNTITFNNDGTVEKVTSCEEVENLEGMSGILEGTNLKVIKLIKKEKLENGKCKILTKFIEGRKLEDLEKAGIIINDLAPRNIFVNDGEVTLLDFEKGYIKLEDLTEDEKKGKILKLKKIKRSIRIGGETYKNMEYIKKFILNFLSKKIKIDIIIICIF